MVFNLPLSAIDQAAQIGPSAIAAARGDVTLCSYFPNYFVSVFVVP